MKIIVSIISIFCLTTFGSINNEEKSLNFPSPELEKSLCAAYAEWSAELAQEEGGSYWGAYFESYGYCIEQQYPTIE